MDSKDVKYLILIALGVYLLSSYIIGNLDSFDSWKITRLIQVGAFGFLAWIYFESKR
jgi:hypothetical protein